MKGIKTVFFSIVEHNRTAILQAIWKNNPKAVIGENATLQCIFSGRWVALYLLINIDIKRNLFSPIFNLKNNVFYFLRNL